MRVIAASQSSVGTVVKHRTVVPKNKNKKDDVAKDSVSSFIHRVRMTYFRSMSMSAGSTAILWVKLL